MGRDVQKRRDGARRLGPGVEGKVELVCPSGMGPETLGACSKARMTGRSGCDQTLSPLVRREESRKSGLAVQAAALPR